jgi:hypothetical protein
MSRLVIFPLPSAPDLQAGGWLWSGYRIGRWWRSIIGWIIPHGPDLLTNRGVVPAEK